MMSALGVLFMVLIACALLGILIVVLKIFGVVLTGLFGILGYLLSLGIPALLFIIIVGKLISMIRKRS